MAAPNRSDERPRFPGLNAVGLPKRWTESARVVATVASFAVLIGLFCCIAVVSVITLAPLAASVAGLAGLLVVWLVGISVIVSTPRLALNCIVAARQAV